MPRSLFKLLFGCAHKRTTFPVKRSSQTHVTCLDCGEELVYDWNRMEIEDGGNRGRGLLHWLQSGRRKAERITDDHGDTR
jgi:RNase P subunit RPR2